MISAALNFLTQLKSHSFKQSEYLHWHSSMKQAIVYVAARFQTQQCMASCVKDLGKVRSHAWQCENVSLVSGREEELCGELAAEFIRSADALSSSRHLSLSVGAQGVTLCLSGCVGLCANICV